MGDSSVGDDRGERALGERTGRGAVSCGAIGAGRVAASGGEPWSDHARSGSDSGRVRVSWNGGAAVRVRHRSSSADVPPAQLSARRGGLHGHARYRYDGGLVVEQRARREHAHRKTDIRRERDFAMRYLNTDGREINWVFIRTLLASVADTVRFPLQDVLGLGTEARMNQPATLGGNWRWRYRAGALTPEITQRLGELTSIVRTLAQGGAG